MCRELGCPHPEERACRTGSANSNGRARASRRMRTAVPPHASRRRLRRLLSMRESQHEGITIARVGCRAKQGLWLFPVFVLFRPVIDGRSPRPERANFPFSSRSLREARAAGLWPAACFSPVIYRKRRLGGERARTLPPPPWITTSRGVGGGAVEGRIAHGLVATVSKPGTRGRARASRLRAAGGARPMQGRRPDVVEHARALHRRRRAGRHVGGLCARRLPALDQAGLRQ